MKEPQDFFTPSELRLDYKSFAALSDERRHSLDPFEREWLGVWEMWDFAVSPMPDNERALLRHGHHAGWFKANEERINQRPA